MTHRYVDLNAATPQAEDNIQTWLTANGIDPGDVPALQYVQVAGEHLIYQAFLRGPEGHKLPLHDSSGEACAWQKQTLSAPLLSTPETHGL